MSDDTGIALLLRVSVDPKASTVNLAGRVHGSYE